MSETLQGQLERIVYFNRDSLYTVAKLNVKGERDLVTAVGQLSGSSPGETLKLSGAWEIHPKYGQQFRAASCTVSLPAKIEEIEKYLGSGLIKGIGPEMAKRLVGQFGAKTLEIIEHNPEKLLGVEGIGKKRLQTIRNAWEGQREIRDVMIFLRGQGVGAGHSSKIFKQYGQDTIRVVRANPYRLSTDISGIGFVTADNIARKLGVPTNSVIRAEAGLLHVLERLCEGGHVYGLYEDVLKRAEELLEIDSTIVKKAFDNLLSSKHIVAEDLQDNHSGAFQAGTPVYLKAFYTVEKGLANRLKAFLSVPVQTLKLQDRKIKKVVQKRLAVILSQEQWSALQTTTSSKISIITGGPGTGKTTLVRAILAVFEKAGKQFLLCAPTGRAAKRLSEVTGRSAKTIHRLLAYNFKSGGFLKNEENPLDTDVVIVDETSMIDLFLMYHLVKAIPVTATLVLVGDVNQLPPVGPGNVLRDMIDSRQVPTVYLNEIFRQAGESLIVVNAHRINEGHFPKMPDSSRNDLRDFYLIEQDDPEKVLSTIQELCCVRIPDRFNLDPLSDIQVLTPMHKGIVGTTNLNRVLQQALNPSKQMIWRMGCAFKQGDKVMQIKNNYTKEVFNGDIGTITKIDVEVQKVTVLYDDYPVNYEFAELDELILAYAISVHKSQGSEYGAVILPVMTQHFVLLQRNLIYTGITRAKELVILIGTKKALAIAIKNDTPQRRLTRLSHRLRQV
ncbi:MAG: recombinase RecD [Desulfobacterales bacterium S7086C20]|nr:MAG: recombinase RecD [Desulfobacterales bacterium S7086C20]